MFVEKWLASKGYNATTEQMTAWRRANMADLTKAFDFDHPDYSIPTFANVSYPSTDNTGLWDGYAVCEATYSVQRPPVPYGNQSVSTSLVSEQGFKAVRGYLTEGRYLTFEMAGYALTSTQDHLVATKATAAHDTKAQRFVIHQSGSGFAITSVVNQTSVMGPGAMRYGGYSSGSATFKIVDLGNGQGHSLQAQNGQYLTIGGNGAVHYSQTPAGFSVFSVTYNN